MLPSPFEGGRPQVAFKDNARGGWKETTGWYGSFVENLVRRRPGTCWRAPCCASNGGFRVILHVHDELVVEIPEEDEHRRDEFLRLVTGLPRWAEGLPLAAKAWVRRR